jgi:predicted phosphohydrolase
MRVTEAEEFFKWFDQIKTYDTKVLIAGNHDRLMENDPEKMLGYINRIQNNRIPSRRTNYIVF